MIRAARAGWLCCAMAALSVLVMTTGTRAQEASGAVAGALVVQMERLLTESDAARSIGRQMEGLRAELRQQTLAADDAIREAERTLAAARPDLEPDIFRARVTEFEASVEAARRTAQARAARVQAAQADAVERLRAALTPILVAVMRERGAAFLFDESQVLLSASQQDVTEEVMARLNAAARAVRVVLPPEAPATDSAEAE